MDAETLKVIAESALESLKCPVCMECMVGPIIMCKEGHSMCKTCKTLCQNCPCCRSPFISVRNIALTSLADSIPISCPNAEWGCTQFVKTKEHADHVIRCRFRRFLCRDTKLECKWSGSYDEYKEHCGQHHHIGLSRRTAWLVPSDFITIEYMSLTISALGELFVFKQKIDQEKEIFQWGVQFIGEQERASEFVYQIIISGSFSNKTVTFSHMCASIFMDDANLFSETNAIKTTFQCVKSVAQYIIVKVVVIRRDSMNRFRRMAMDMDGSSTSDDTSTPSLQSG